MKKRILVTISLILFSCMCYSQEFSNIFNSKIYFQPYDTQDWVLQSVFTVITTYDWMQTKQFRSEGKPEANPFLGKYPSQQKVDTMIFGAIVAHAAVTYFLPKKYRAFWQVPFIVAETIAVTHNYSVGVRIGGKW